MHIATINDCVWPIGSKLKVPQERQVRRNPRGLIAARQAGPGSSLWLLLFAGTFRRCPCQRLPRGACRSGFRPSDAQSDPRSFTLRLRSHSLAPVLPAILVIFFMVRISTRTPSPNKLESVG